MLHLFVNWNISTTFLSFSIVFFIEPTIFHHFSAFLTNRIDFHSHFFFCRRPARNAFPCLVSFFLFCFRFTFCPFFVFSRKYFLRNCDSSFSIFRHALQTFSTFDAFSNFLLTFHFYMIFLSICGIIFKKKENLYYTNYFSFNLYVKLIAWK